jgi:hypothetical protein
MNAEQIILTPELAARYLKQASPEHRKLSQRAVDYYASDMKKGRWVLSNDAICFDTNNLMINGQHRCHAVLLSNIAIQVMTIRGMEPDSFSIIDTGKNRNRRDVISMIGCKDAGVISAVLTNIYLYKRNRLTIASNGYMQVSNQDVLDTHKEHKDVSNYLNYPNDAKSIISKHHCIFCSYIFSHIDSSISGIFLDKLIHGIGLDGESPILHLRNRLITEKQNKTRMCFNKKLALTFHAWNLFYSDTKVKKIQMPNEMPKVLGCKLQGSIFTDTKETIYHEPTMNELFDRIKNPKR